MLIKAEYSSTVDGWPIHDTIRIIVLDIYKQDGASGHSVTCTGQFIRCFPGGCNTWWENTKGFFQNLQEGTEKGFNC